jgi:hypothetical protein
MGLAWNTPSSRTCRSMNASRVRARASRSRPRSAMTGSAVVNEVPSSRCMTRTRSEHNGVCGTGTPPRRPCRDPPPRPRPCCRPRCGSRAPRGAPRQSRPPGRGRRWNAPPGTALHGAGEPRHDVQVALDHRPDSWALHLHHHLRARPQPSGVRLGDGGGGERLTVEPGEHLLDLPAQVGAEHLLDLRPRRRGGPVLQPAQLVGELRREEVGTGGQDLAELDEGDPAFVERSSYRPCQLVPGVRRVQLSAPPPSQVRPETVADRDPADLGAPPGAGEPPAELAAPRHRPRQRPGWHQRLGDHQEHHGNDQGGRRGQHEEPRRGDGALGGRDRPEDRPGDGPHHREREQAGGQQPHHPNRMPSSRRARGANPPTIATTLSTMRTAVRAMARTLMRAHHTHTTADGGNAPRRLAARMLTACFGTGVR